MFLQNRTHEIAHDFSTGVELAQARGLFQDRAGESPSTIVISVENGQRESVTSLCYVRRQLRCVRSTMSGCGLVGDGGPERFIVIIPAHSTPAASTNIHRCPMGSSTA
jgi:hypothetical protein